MSTRFIPSLSIRLTMSLLLMAFSLSTYAQSELRQILQLAEYIGVDYSEAVQDGEVLDEGEYQEMLEFSSLILDEGAKLATVNADERFRVAASSLFQLVRSRGDQESIVTLTIEIRALLLDLSPGLSLPASLSPVNESASAFSDSCAMCHGISGQGNGVLANQMLPAPTDFTDIERSRNRSILGLFDVISNGIDGTTMPAFEQLSIQQRWSLAFYVGSLAFNIPDESVAVEIPQISTQDFVNFSPNSLLGQFPDIPRSTIDSLRANPHLLFTTQNDPLGITRRQLGQSHDAYLDGNYQEALRLAVSAYLDGFELIENSLDARDSNLRREIETNLLSIRQLLSVEGQELRVEQNMQLVLQQLQQAEDIMEEGALSVWTLFVASFVILVREGLEALLVVIALATVLIKTERKDALRYLHLGWVTALISGLATWWAAQHLFSISGASREIMEGLAALLASIVLLYVGFWMHSKSNAVQWQKYIKHNIDKNLKKGTLWGIAGLAFIAVYREVFETVLFYQSLLTQTDSNQIVFVSGGFISGVILLTLIAALMIHYSVKLPLAIFFSTTTYLLLALSFVLMGKAVLALQEAAVIDISPLPVNISVSWLGIGSTWQGILSQALVLILSVIMMYKASGYESSANE